MLMSYCRDTQVMVILCCVNQGIIEPTLPGSQLADERSCDKMHVNVSAVGFREYLWEAAVTRRQLDALSAAQRRLVSQ